MAILNLVKILLPTIMTWLLLSKAWASWNPE